MFYYYKEENGRLIPKSGFVYTNSKEDADIIGFNEKCTECPVVGWDNNYYKDESYIPEMTEEDILYRVSLKIDEILKETSFRIAEDEPNRDSWVAYRILVRDIINQSDLSNIVWPEPPNA